MHSTTIHTSKTMMVLSILALALTTALVWNTNHTEIEHFTAPGWTLTRAPEWFWPAKEYNADDWLTPYFPDQIRKPECLPYDRGHPGILNYNSSAYRFWRY